MNWHINTLLLLALGSLGSAQAANLSFACPPNPAPGTQVTLGPIVTNGNWAVSASPATPSTTTLYKHPAWAAPKDGGDWISIAENATPLGTSFTFTSDDVVQVNPVVVDVNSIQATVKAAADNYLDNFLVIRPSGVNSLAASAGFTPITTQTYTTPGLEAGDNRIGFVIRNSEGTQGIQAGGARSTPMGLFASVTLTATCLTTPPPAANVSAVPTQSTGTLAGLSMLLAGLSAWRLRRGKTAR